MPFTDIAGHARLRTLLASAVQRGTLPPSLIFAGPQGVGKRRTAVALAQRLNCLSPVELSAPGVLDACGRCASCRRIARGVHSDVLLIEPGENGSIRIDPIRDAIERSVYRPFEGRRRVVIIDDADAVLAEAQNALLKTLEEPPASSVFVLVTARPDLLLVTVRSRCQRLRFGRLAPAEVAEVLERDHGFTHADATAAAAAGDGTVLAAMDAGSESLGLARAAAVGVLEAAAASRAPRRRLDAAKLLVAGGGDRQSLRLRLRALASMLRDLGLLQAGAGDEPLANSDRGVAEALQRVQGAFDGERTVRAFDAVGRASAALDRNASPKIVADWIALQI